jgi:hypothetical protein
MQNMNRTKRKVAMDEIEKSLVEIWDALSPHLKNRGFLFNRFFKIQLRARHLNKSIERTLVHEPKR